MNTNKERTYLDRKMNSALTKPRGKQKTKIGKINVSSGHVSNKIDLKT